MDHEGNDGGARMDGSRGHSVTRHWLTNGYRGLLLVVDIGTGGLMAVFGLGAASDPGPWGLEWPTILLAGAAVILGLWLVAAGVLLVVTKRPTCWGIGTWTHAIAGCGFLLLIAALRNEARHTLAQHPGHMAMESDLASGLLSVVSAVLGIVWLVGAALLFAVRIAETTTASPELLGHGRAGESQENT